MPLTTESNAGGIMSSTDEAEPERDDAAPAAVPELVPTDPLYAQQWHFGLLGDIEAIWADYTGAGVHAGVYDEGIDTVHVDLNDNYDATREFTYNGVTYSGAATGSHGTAVAGLIAAENNGVGAVGVAFDADVTGINIFNSSSPLFINAPAASNAGFFAALRSLSFDVVNNSWGGFAFYYSDDNINTAGSFARQTTGAWDFVAANGRGGLGTIVVKSAGNDTRNTGGDNSETGRSLISVAAALITGNPADYSNHGANILVAAPGGGRLSLGQPNVLTTDRTGSAGYTATDYTTFNGTSAAAPVVSGVVSLMLDANADIGWRDVQNILSLSATHTGSGLTATGPGLYENDVWKFNDATNWNGGGLHFSNDYGFGMVNAYNAARMAEVWSLFAPAKTSANEVSTTASNSVAQAIQDNATTTSSFTVTDDIQIENLQLTVNLTHSYFADLRIRLTAPDGTVYILEDGTGNAGNGSASDNGLVWTYGINGLRGESSVGTWTVSVEDVAAGDTGTLNSVSGTFYGSASSANDVYHFTNEFQDVAALDGARRIVTDSDGGTDWLDMAAIFGNLVANLAPGAASTLDGAAFVTIANNAAIENLVAGDGNDVITGNGLNNSLYGMRGNDFIAGGDGDDQLFGGAGDDMLNGGLGANLLDGGAGIDQISFASYGPVTFNLATGAFSGNSASFTLVSIEGIVGSDYDDVLTGDANANLIEGGTGNDTLDGGDGVDTLSYANAGSAVFANLSFNFAQDTFGAGTDTITNFENLVGSNYNDLLTGNSGNNILIGGTGDDSLSGADGDDVLDGGAGFDTANYNFAASGVTVSLGVQGPQNTGGAGVDTLISIEAIIGSLYNDNLTGGLGGDLLTGAGGTDTVHYETATGAVTVNLATNSASGALGNDTLFSIENVQGSAYADTLIGDGGNNSLTGNDGDDILEGGAGDDFLEGANGYDTASYASASSGVSVSLTLLGQVQNTGGAGSDQLQNIENLRGSAYNDTLTGNAGDNILEGGAGDDTLEGRIGTDMASYASATSAITVNLQSQGIAQNTGGAGTDTLVNIEGVFGSAFDDVLTGSSSSELFEGGAGNDTINGGDGTDTARYLSATAGVTVSLLLQGSAQNTIGAGSDTLGSIEQLIGSAFADRLTGNAGNNSLTGNDGDDTLEGGDGNDFLEGANGYDTASYASATAGVTVNLNLLGQVQNTGGAGSDQLQNIENLLGSAFNDTLTGNAGDNVIEGGAGNDIINGGGGTDIASYASAAAAVTVLLYQTTAQNTIGAGIDTLTNIEGVIGSAFDDYIYGSNASGDIIEGGAGNDSLDGGNGIDTASYASASAGVTVNLRLFSAQNTGGAGTDTLGGFENIVGSAFNDVLTGFDVQDNHYNGANFNGDNRLSGGAGDDILAGGGGRQGNDIFDGGTGFDTVSYAAVGVGAVTVSLATGSTVSLLGTDTLISIEQVIGGFLADTLTGSAGNDVLAGGPGGDKLDGGAGIDTASYFTAAAAVTANLDVPFVNSGDAAGDTYANIENLTGSAFNDTLTGNAGANLLTGGDGDDILDGGSGNDRLDGGAGIDTASYLSAIHAVTVFFGLQGVAQDTGGAGIDTLISIEKIIGSTLDDTLIAGTAAGVASSLDGGEGHDLLIAGLGNDTLAGGNGIDTVSYAAATAGVTVSLALTAAQNTGGAGTDTLTAFENLTGSSFGDTLTGNAGANIIDGGLGDDTIDGGAGIDTASYANADSAVNVNLSGGQATGGAGTDTLVNIENVTGSAFDDTVLGNAANNAVTGGDGNDFLLGLEGDDALDGGAGDDLLFGGTGNDVLRGGAGTDTVYYNDALSGVTVSLAITTAQNTGGGGIDTLSGIEWILGSAYDDALTGNSVDNLIEGGAGNDMLVGGGGNDRFTGGAGNDTLFASAGDDDIDGGADVDRLSYALVGAGVTVLLTSQYQTTGGAGVDIVRNIENLTGSAFNDTLGGTDLDNVLDGGAGTDAITYALAGGGVTVSLAVVTAQNTGGAGTDTLAGFENVIGSGYDDVLAGTGGNNVIDGGAGTDTVSFAGATSGVTVNLLTGAQTGGGLGSDMLISIERVIGGNFADTLTGDGNANTLTGGAGNDSIDGGAGDDLIEGGIGNDALAGGGGTDTLSYANATSRVTVNLAITAVQGTRGAGNDTISGFENVIGSIYNDTVAGDGGNNQLYGGASNDTLSGGDGYDQLFGGAGDDILIDASGEYYGGDGFDIASFATSTIGLTIQTTAFTYGVIDLATGFALTMSSIEGLIGTNFNDTLYGDERNNKLSGGAGSDTIKGDLGNDAIDGGSGVDTLDYSGIGAGVTLNLNVTFAQNTGGAGNDAISAIENVIGTAFNDTLTGNQFGNALTGGDGSDTLIGGLGVNVLNGGNGIDTASYAAVAVGVRVNLGITTSQTTSAGAVDTLSGIENVVGSAFNDILTGDGGDNVLTGGVGDDVLQGGLGNDSLIGGQGIDTVTYAAATAGITVSLASATTQITGGAGTDTLSSIENLTGSNLADMLTGSGVANIIGGGLGNDVIDSGSGDDVIDGGRDNDTLKGAAGDDLITGGLGNDSIDGGANTAVGDTVSYSAATSAVTVSLALTTAQAVGGGQGTDTIVNVENILGSAFGDTLSGSAGANRLTGGAGADMLTGGGGIDRFVYLAVGDSTTAASDRIIDFASGEILDLSAIDANTASAGTNEAFHQVGSFTGAAGEFTLAYNGGTNTTTLIGHVDTDGIADLQILFTGDVTGFTGSWVL